MTAVNVLFCITVACAASVVIGLMHAMRHADTWAQLAFGFGLVGVCVFGLCLVFAWFEENER